MDIGIDVSGNLLPGDSHAGFESSVMVAALVPPSARTEIQSWVEAAMSRWGRRGTELHMKQIQSWRHRREIVEMLAGRADVRFSAILTDSRLTGPTSLVREHRAAQLRVATQTIPQTDRGRETQRIAIGSLALDDDRDPPTDGDHLPLRDGQYLYGVVFPRLLMAGFQHALCFYADDRWRDDMATVRVIMDTEKSPTVAYCKATLLPTLAGDERFSIRWPDRWRRDPVHPLFASAVYPDGDGARGDVLFGNVAWVDSNTEVAIQLADVTAWVINRAAQNPDDRRARQLLDTLRPLLATSSGDIFDLHWTFSRRNAPMSHYSEQRYGTLRTGALPDWWLRPVPSRLDRRSVG